ncbi:unnamed protein product, partial [marine sediment metagenome]
YASINTTYGSDSWLYVTIKAETAAGALSNAYATEQRIYVSNVDAAAVNGDFTVNRG